MTSDKLFGASDCIISAMRSSGKCSACQADDLTSVCMRACVCIRQMLKVQLDYDNVKSRPTVTVDVASNRSQVQVHCRSLFHTLTHNEHNQAHTCVLHDTTLR